jgi:hypothetical protein
VPFKAHEGWIYALRLKEKTPEWVYDRRYGAPLPPLRARELVMIGLQLEDGPRIERKVKSELDEHGLKLMMWETLGYPARMWYLPIRNARDETQFEFRIGPQWTDTLRRQPVNTLKQKPETRRVDDKDGDMTSATRKIREARNMGTSGSRNQGAGNRLTRLGKSRARRRSEEQNRTVSRSGEVFVISLPWMYHLIHAVPGLLAGCFERRGSTRPWWVPRRHFTTPTGE